MRVALRTISHESQVKLTKGWDHADYHLDTEGRCYKRVTDVVDFDSRYLDGKNAYYLINESASLADLITCVAALHEQRNGEWQWNLAFVVVDK